MEFLMTYGWAILVVLVAIGALAYFGVLNPGRFLPSSCTIAPGISCDEFKIDGTNDRVDVVLRNGLGNDITSVSINIDNCTTQSTLADGDDNWVDGSQMQLTGASGVTGCGPFVAGGRFKQTISVAYSLNGIAHNKTGTITAQVE